MFIVLYCCLLVRMQPPSLTWAGLHDTKSLWALFLGSIVEFWVGYSIFYLGTSKIFPLTTVFHIYFLPIFFFYNIKYINTLALQIHHKGFNFTYSLTFDVITKYCLYIFLLHGFNFTYNFVHLSSFILTFFILILLL